MNEITIEQINGPHELSVKDFAMQLVRILIALCIVQIAINLAAAFTDIHIPELLFPVLIIGVLLVFVWNTVALTEYSLHDKHLVLSKKLGDISVQRMELDIDQLVAVRPHLAGEDLSVTYKQVHTFGENCKTPVRVKLAFVLSTFSSRLARKVAGNAAEKPCGTLLVVRRRDAFSVCVIEPGEELARHLELRLSERYGMDDRMGRPRLEGFRARNRAHAFPQMHPHVRPLVTKDDLEWAEKEEQEIRERKEERKRQKDRLDQLQQMNGQKSGKASAKSTASGKKKNSARKQSGKAEGKQRKPGRADAGDQMDPDAIRQDAQNLEDELPGMEVLPHPEFIEMERKLPIEEIKDSRRRRRNGSREEKDVEEDLFI